MDVILSVSFFIHVSYFMLAYWCTDVVQPVGLANGLLRATATRALVLFFAFVARVCMGQNGTGLHIYMLELVFSFNVRAT